MINQNAVAGFRRALREAGVPVTFQRVEGAAPATGSFYADVVAIVRNYTPDQPVAQVKPEGSITQGDREVQVLNSDLQAKGWPLPVKKNDKIVVGGETLNVKTVDPNKKAAMNVTVITAVGV